MKPLAKRRLRAALLLLLPIVLFLVIRERQSWRPRVLGQMKLAVSALAWSPDGKALASGGEIDAGMGGDILLWDVKTGIKRRLQSEQSDGVYRLWFLQNSKLACRTYRNKLLIYDAQRGVAWSRPQTIEIQGSWAISPDCRQIISKKEQYEGPTPPGCLMLREFPGGKTVILGSPDTRSMAINRMAFSPDAKRFAAFVYNSPRNRGPAVWLWDLQAPQIPHILRLPDKSVSAAELMFWPDSASIAGTSFGELFVVDTTSGQVEKHWRGTGGILALSPDGETVARGNNSEIALYKYPSMRLVRHWPVLSLRSYTHSLAFAPDGRTLAVGDDKGFITLWRVK